MPIDRDGLLDTFRRAIPHPVSPAELSELLGLGEGDRGWLEGLLGELTSSGDLVRIKGNRFGLPQKMNLVVGQLRATPKGFGFVVPEKAERGAQDVFVRQPNMGGALHGDRVVARIEHKKADGRLEGSIIRVLERANQRLIGKYELGPRAGGLGEAPAYGYVVPLEAKLLTDVIIPPEHTLGAKEGEIVEAEILEFPGKTREATGRIVDRIGWAQNPGIDLELVLRRHSLPRGFDPEVSRAAAAVPQAPSPAETARRTDFRDDQVVTIDGEKARDFDDAVSATRLAEGGWRVQVHIADVSHYVRPGTAIDDEARARGTSTYFPNHVIPMLPEQLSNGICSLNPAVERLTLSLVMDLSPQGEVRDYRFHEGVIRSAARLTYEAVHAILVDRDPALRARHGEVVALLETLEKAAAAVGRRRRQRGSLDFDLPESAIVLNEQGEMTGIRRGARLVSHNLIEEFMILANETVAEHFLAHDMAAVYRVHEPPDPGDVEELNASLELFGYQVDENAPKTFRRVLETVKGRPEERFVNTIVLRTMKLARYQAENIGHFGLASEAYTHFTSPIRRYPDLVVHRRIKDWMSSEPAASDPGRARSERRRREPQVGDLDLLAAACSRLERRSEDGEREYIERKKARFMADKVGERFSAVITSVEAFGCFVELEEYFVEGLIHLTALHDDYYIHDEAGHRLVGEHTGRTFRLGERLEVELTQVDLLQRKITFIPVEAVTGTKALRSARREGEGNKAGRPGRGKTREREPARPPRGRVSRGTGAGAGHRERGSGAGPRESGSGEAPSRPGGHREAAAGEAGSAGRRPPRSDERASGRHRQGGAAASAPAAPSRRRPAKAGQDGGPARAGRGEAPARKGGEEGGRRERAGARKRARRAAERRGRRRG